MILIWKKLELTRGEDAELKYAIIKKQIIDTEGKPVGKANTNSILDSRQYEVEYFDKDIEILTIHFITEIILAQVDDKGRRQMFIDKREDHRVPSNTVLQSNGFIATHTETKRRRRTLRGWEFYIRWKDRPGD